MFPSKSSIMKFVVIIGNEQRNGRETFYENIHIPVHAKKTLKKLVLTEPFQLFLNNCCSVYMEREGDAIFLSHSLPSYSFLIFSFSLSPLS